MEDNRLRDLNAGGDQVIGKRPRLEVAISAIDKLFHQGSAQSLGKPAANLAIHQLWIEHSASVMKGHITIYADSTGDGINLYPAIIKNEAITQGTVDQLIVTGSLQFRRSPERRFPKAARLALGCCSRRPVSGACQAVERRRLVRTLHINPALREPDIVAIDIPLLRGKGG